MSTTTALAPARLPDQDLIQSVLLGGDIAKLDSQQRVDYYLKVCETLGLNPYTQPFEFINLNGKLRFYATKNCAEQLRRIYGVALTITSREAVEGCYVVAARAADKWGRTDESIGSVPIEGLKGENRSNAMMKAETKAKRRVTLSICGLGMLDETEVDSTGGMRVAPGDLGKVQDVTVSKPATFARPVERPAGKATRKWGSDPKAETVSTTQTTTGSGSTTPDAVTTGTPDGVVTAPITKKQLALAHILKAKCGIDDTDWKKRLTAKFGVESSKDLTADQAATLIDALERLAARAAEAVADIAAVVPEITEDRGDEPSPEEWEAMNAAMERDA